MHTSKNSMRRRIWKILQIFLELNKAEVQKMGELWWEWLLADLL